MRMQPKVGYTSDDCVQTPKMLCQHIVRLFKPSGKVLEPCAGDGNFVAALEEYGARHLKKGGVFSLDTCEIKKGRDFYDYNEKADWIITNPPWSQLRSPRGKDTHPMSFLAKCFEVADNVVLLLTLNHAIGLKSRFSMADKYERHIKEIILLDTPPEPWPQSGFQVACVHWAVNSSPGKEESSYTVRDWRGFHGRLYREEQEGRI